MKNRIVSTDQWREARLILLEKEKAFTKMRDELSQERRALPWIKLAKDYTFETTHGQVRMADLFGKNSQLIVYHFMYGPNQENACKSCSFWADLFNPAVPHLNQRDVTLLCISRGQIEKLQAYKKRMGWTFEWVSSLGSDFNFDFGATSRAGVESEYNYKKSTTEKENERHAFSVFVKDESEAIFHTYSCYAREAETYNSVYRFLDTVPKGRDEGSLAWPMAWVNYHDKY